MCVPILRSIGTHIDELRKHAKIVFYLTSRDVKKRHAVHHVDLILLIGISTNFEINRYTLMHFKNMPKSCFILRHVTQKRYVVHHGDLILRSGTI